MLGKGFVDKYNELSAEKESILCVGIDPAILSMRSRYVVPDELLIHSEADGIKDFCLNLIEAVSSYTPIIKPNAQFLFYILGFEEIKEIVEKIHEKNELYYGNNIDDSPDLVLSLIEGYEPRLWTKNAFEYVIIYADNYP